LLDRREGGEPGVSSPGLAAPGTSSSRNRGSYAVSAFGGPSWTPVRLAPAAHPRLRRGTSLSLHSVQRAGLRAVRVARLLRRL